MSNKIEYNKELFSILNDLKMIDNGIGIAYVLGPCTCAGEDHVCDCGFDPEAEYGEGDGPDQCSCCPSGECGREENARIEVRKSDENETIGYILSVPLKYFDIRRTIAFYQYDHFYKSFCTYKDAELELDPETPMFIDIISGRSSMNYKMSDTEDIINGPTEIDIDAWNLKFTMPSEVLDTISRGINNAKADRANLYFDSEEKQLILTFFTEGGDNTAREVLDVEVVTETEDFQFDIFADRFTYLPARRDYEFSIHSAGFMRMSLLHPDGPEDGMSLDVYSGDVS